MHSNNKPYILITLILLAILSSCSTTKVNLKKAEMEEISITIIGNAQNAKTGAIILTENNKIYYIDKLDSWDENTVGMKMEVSGLLKKEIFKEEDLKDETGAWIQGMVGEKLTILNARMKHINN